MYTLTPALRATHIDNPADAFAKIGLHSYTKTVGKLGLTNGYGLFRSMTGVGWDEVRKGEAGDIYYIYVYMYIYIHCISCIVEPPPNEIILNSSTSLFTMLVAGKGSLQ